MSTQTQSDLALQIRREIDTPISKVYGAWADSESFAAWFDPGSCRVMEVDFKPEIRCVV